MAKYEGPKAFNVSFTDAPCGPGRHHRAKYQTAVVIAFSACDAARIADNYRMVYFPKLRVEDIRLDDNLVIMETDEDGALT